MDEGRLGGRRGAGGRWERTHRNREGREEGGGEARPTAWTLTTAESSPRACPQAGRGSCQPPSPTRPTPGRRAPKAPSTSLPPQPTAPPRPPQALAAAAASYLGHIVLHLIQVSIFEGPHEFLVRHRGRLAETRAGEAARGRQHLHGARAAARRAGAPPPAGGRSLARCPSAGGRLGGAGPRAGGS